MVVVTMAVVRVMTAAGMVGWKTGGLIGSMRAVVVTLRRRRHGGTIGVDPRLEGQTRNGAGVHFHGAAVGRDVGAGVSGSFVGRRRGKLGCGVRSGGTSVRE